MGLGGISISSLLLIFLIVLLLFGTNKLRNVGSDLGAAIKSFRDGMDQDNSQEDTNSENNVANNQETTLK